MSEQSFSKTYVIYPTQDSVVKAVARRFEGNESMALRCIINDYDERHPDTDGRGQLVDTRLPYAIDPRD